MAPVDRVDHDGIERTHPQQNNRFQMRRANCPPAEQLKDVIQDLYQVMVQVSTYDSMGRPSKDVLSNELYEKKNEKKNVCSIL
jgi:mediator of RNA polymerase II transcription subunit 10